MFKLSLAFAVSSVVGQVSLSSFCTELENKCSGTYGVNASTCATVFANVPLGAVTDEDVHSVGCRLKFLTVPAFNVTNACRYAGPSGGGRCGSPLVGVCDVATAACTGQPTAAYATSAECQTGLTPLANQWGHTQGPAAGGEDSLECRSYHAIASLSLGNSHCAHYNLTSPPCVGRVVPNAAYYCQTLQYNCKATNVTQFSGNAECAGTAAVYPTSSSDSAVPIGNNTLGCRSYHAQAALGDTSHCAHAGPSGGRVCGTYGEAWATLSKGVCNDTATFTFINAVGPTLDNLVPRGAGSYSTTLDVGGNTQVCRIYHLTVSTTTPSHCDHSNVPGENVCGTIDGNLCDLIGSVCAFGSNASYQYANRAACIDALSNKTEGVYGANSGDSLQCRYYHVGVAASYQNASANWADITTHCGHVIATPKAGCNAVAAPTAAAPTAGMSSASALSLVLPATVALSAVFTL